MRRRLRSQDGFLTIELIAAVFVITIAVIALMAAYVSATGSLNSADKSSAAGLLAENQLELYASLQYTSIGLDSAKLFTANTTDPNYRTDEAALPGSGSDVTISGCGVAAQCLPVQTLTGSDHHHYKLETFIRALTNPSTTSWTEKVVTVVVRDLSTSGSPKVLTIQTAFDEGPES